MTSIKLQHTASNDWLRVTSEFKIVQKEAILAYINVLSHKLSTLIAHQTEGLPLVPIFNYSFILSSVEMWKF